MSASIPSFGVTYGALFFSALISTGFYSITCMQAFFYYVHYPDDPLSTRIFIATQWVLCTVHDTLTIAGVYRIFILGMTETVRIPAVPPELIFQMFITVLISVPTQGFFVHRIYALTRKNLIVPIIWVPLAIYQFGGSILFVAKALYLDHGLHVSAIALGSNLQKILVFSLLAVAAAVDILTALSLTILLVRKRTATAYSGTTHLLRRLMIFSINTGIWTATFALLTLLLMYFYPATSLGFVFGLPLSSVYCNTLLANLNARAYVRDGSRLNTHNVELRASELSRTERRSREIKVRVEHSVHDHHDRDRDRDLDGDGLELGELGRRESEPVKAHRSAWSEDVGV